MISIILPCYNGSGILSKQLPGFIEYLKSEIKHFEVIIVDDGSEDRLQTHQIAQKNGCKFMALDKNKGKGAAVRAGIIAASGDMKIFTDVDIPFLYKCITTIIDELKKGADVVIGDRNLQSSSYFEEISSLRKLGSSIFTFIVERVITKGIRDTQCGLKGFTREASEKIFRKSVIEGFSFDVEVLIIATNNKLEVRRIPVTLRNQDESSVSLWRHSVGMLMDLARIKIREQMGRYK